MTDISPKFSVRPDRPVDPLLVDILKQVDPVAREQGIAYFVGGAMARDLILQHVFDKDTGRATRDVDFGVCIDEWDKLAAFKAGLANGGNFTEQKKVAHRLIYRVAPSDFGTPVDLLPFGGVENAQATIAWPPDMDVILNVAGFADAYASTLPIEVAPGFLVPVTSLASLAALKLIAWRDRHLKTEKDASDFLLIARHYADAGNLDRLYETEQALLEAAGFELEVAGAALLGKDVAQVCLPETARQITAMLATPALRLRLVDQMLRHTLLSGDAAGSARIAQCLDAFQKGFDPSIRHVTS
jgi:predicted nucleotidyltransferase